MQCDKCMLEMRMASIEDNVMHFKCVKCGKAEDKTIDEVEKLVTE